MTSETTKMKQQSTLLTRGASLIEGVLNLLFLLLYLMAWVAPVVSPCLTQIPALLNLAFLPLLALLICLLLLYLLRQKWYYFFAYFGLFLLSSPYIFTYLPLHYGKGLHTHPPLRLLTYNVAGMSYTDSSGHPLALQEILRQNAHIVALQEAPSLPWLRKTLGKQYPYIYKKRYQSPALLSKYPILWSKEIEYPTFANGSVAHYIELPQGQHLLLVNNHMESYAMKQGEIEEYRSFLTQLRIRELPKQILEVQRRLGPKLKQRAVAAELVRQAVRHYIQELSPNAVILLGDLNDTPMSYTYTQLRDGRRDAFRETGLGLGTSFSVPPLHFRIDHLLYSGQIEAIGSCIPSRKQSSDHNPLIVDFRILE